MRKSQTWHFSSITPHDSWPEKMSRCELDLSGKELRRTVQHLPYLIHHTPRHKEYSDRRIS